MQEIQNMLQRLKYLVIVSSIGFIAGCNTSGVKYPEVSPIFGLATPIQLSPEDTHVPLYAYFSQRPRIDSITAHPSLTVRLDSAGYFCDISRNRALELPQLTTLKVFVEGVPYSILVKETKRVRHLINYKKSDLELLGPDFDKVYIKGDFSNWQPLELNPTKSNEFYIELDLNPGSYAYKLMLGKTKNAMEIADPTNSVTKPNGRGGENNILTVDASETSEAGYKVESSSQTSLEVTTLPGTELLIFWENFELQPQKLEPNKYAIRIPPFAKKDPRSHLRIFGYNGSKLAQDALIPLRKGKIIKESTKLNRQDFHTNIMYGIDVPTFMNGGEKHDLQGTSINDEFGANYQEGNLKGITEKIMEGYFDSLGVNTISLSPIASNWITYKNNLELYTRNRPISYSQIDTRLGTAADLRTLLDEAHKKQLNVLLDYTAHQVDIKHPVYQLHPEWATSPRNYEGTRQVEHPYANWLDSLTPKMNLLDQEVTEAMADSAIFWAKNFNFDGYKFTATNLIPGQFWLTFTTNLKNDISVPQRRKMYQIGEVNPRSKQNINYAHTGMLDGQYDYKLYDVAWKAFTDLDGDFREVATQLKNTLETYGYHHLMGNITPGSASLRSETGIFSNGKRGDVDAELEMEKAMDSLYKEKQMLFHAFMLTIPGVPIIYQGDESCMSVMGENGSPAMMNYGLNSEEKKCYDQVKNLAKTRRSNMALLYGGFSIIKAEKDVLIYKRSYLYKSVYVILNKGKQPFEMLVNGRPFFECNALSYSIKFVDNSQNN